MTPDHLAAIRADAKRGRRTCWRPGVGVIVPVVLEGRTVTVITEEYRCPLSGSDTGAVWPHQRPRTPPGPTAILMPGRILPAATTDAQAEHERAMHRADSWSRAKDGRVYLWVER